MKVLVVASSKTELSYFSGSYSKAVSGVGPVLAAAVTASAINEVKPDVVFSVGSAGSMGKLGIGECLSFGSVIMPDMDLTAYGLERGVTLLPAGKKMGRIMLDSNSDSILSTSSSFAAEPMPGADAADMEAYGVAVAASLSSIPCYAVKVITDIVGKHVSLKEYGTTLRSLLFKLPAKVEEVLQSFSA